MVGAVEAAAVLLCRLPCPFSFLLQTPHCCRCCLAPPVLLPPARPPARPPACLPACRWDSSGYFKPDESAPGEPYVISMPPPNVTGKLHMGHAMFATLQVREHTHA